MYDPVTEDEFKKRQRQKQHQKYVEKHPTRVVRGPKEAVCKEVIDRKEMISSSDSSSERKLGCTKEKKGRNFYIEVGKMMARYNVNNFAVDTILLEIKAGEIAVQER